MFRNIITATLTAGLCCSNLADATLKDGYVIHDLPNKYIEMSINNVYVPPVRKEYLKIQRFYDKYDGVLSYDFIAYMDAVLEEERINHKVSLTDMLALIEVESQFDHHRESKAGAYGLCQIMPATAKSLNELYNRNLDRKNDYDNVRMAAIYLKDLYMRYKEPEAVYRFYNGGTQWSKKPSTLYYYKTVMRKSKALAEFIRT